MLPDPAETLHHPTGITGIPISDNQPMAPSAPAWIKRHDGAANAPIPTPTLPAPIQALGFLHHQGQAQNYQALDNLQQLLHDHSNALVAQEPTDGLEMRRPHEVAVGAVDVAVGDVERLQIGISDSYRTCNS